MHSSDDPTGMTGSNNRIRMGYDTVGLTVSREVRKVKEKAKQVVK